MTTFAWLLILVAILLIRAVSRGRVLYLGQDLSDAFLAIAEGNTAKFGEVIGRKGDASAATVTDVTPVGQAIGSALTGPGIGVGVAGATAAQGLTNALLVTNMEGLGKKAKGYVLGATGPEWYDCSGLMWRALQTVGYKGGRFVTSTMKTQGGSQFVSVDTPLVGDIALWPIHHVGVVTGPNRFYSARNPNSGISETAISTFRPEPPEYLRFVGGK